LKKKKMLNLEDSTDDEKTKVLLQLQQDLRLPAVPYHIECFDNSNFQGSFPYLQKFVLRMDNPAKQTIGALM